MSEVAELAKNVTCAIWAISPARLLARFPGAENSQLANFGKFLNDFCSDRPNQINPPAELDREGGKCPVLYNFSRSGRAINRDNGQVDNWSLTSQILGPVTILGTVEVENGFRGLFVRNGAGELVQASPLYSRALWRNFSYTIGGFTRVDGGLDDCGDERLRFLPPTVEEGDEDGIEFEWPFEFDPDVTINLPIGLIPKLNPPGIDVTVSGVFNFNFNLGGINFNIGPNSGVDGTDLTPIQDGIGDLSVDISEFRNEISETVTNTNTLVNDLVEDVEDVTDTVAEILEDTRFIGVPLNIPTTAAGDVCLTVETQANTIFEAVRIVGGELVEERQRECGGSLSEERLIAEGTSSISQRSVYVSVPATTVRARLELVGDLPSKASFYQTNEPTGNFGALSEVGTENALGATQTVFTRDTLLVIDSAFPLVALRVFLVPRISWKLFIVERI